MYECIDGCARRRGGKHGMAGRLTTKTMSDSRPKKEEESLSTGEERADSMSCTSSSPTRALPSLCVWRQSDTHGERCDESMYWREFNAHITVIVDHINVNIAERTGMRGPGSSTACAPWHRAWSLAALGYWV